MILKEVCEKILRGWLLGVSRDQIAESLGVAEGTITNVIEFYKQNDNTIDLQRQIAVVAHKSDTNISQIASNLSWDNALKRAGSDNQNVIDFVSQLHKECDINGITEKQAISIIIQIADFVTKEKIPLTKVASYVENGYAELERVEAEIAKNKQIQQKSNADVQEVVAKNIASLDEIKDFLKSKETLQAYGLWIGDLAKTVNFINKLKKNSYDISSIISKLSSIDSLERRRDELDRDCEYYEANLTEYGLKLKAAEDYWGKHEASAELYANSIAMGLTPQDIFDAVTIFGKNPNCTPQEIINAIKIYGGIMSAICKSYRELRKLDTHINKIPT